MHMFRVLHPLELLLNLWKVVPAINLPLKFDKRCLVTSYSQPEAQGFSVLHTLKNTFFARAAQYRLTSPFLAIFSEIVQGPRLRALTMVLIRSPRDRLHDDMHSRLSNDNAFGRRDRVRGSIPRDKANGNKPSRAASRCRQ